LGGVGANIAVGEDGAAGDQQLCAGFYYVGYGFQIHSTINFNAEIEFAFGAHAGECGNFVQGIRNEFLAAEAGIHAHDQDVVNEIENFSERFNGSGWIEDYAGFAAMRSDEVKRAIEMDAGFLVDGHPVGAGFGKFGDEEIGIFDHQVAIERDFELFAQRAHDGRADGEVGNEVAVHDVEVQDGAATVDGLLGVDGELREICGEN